MPDWLDPKAPTLARFLKGAGYRTGHFGKWHLTNHGAVGAPEPSAYGFDESAVFNGPGDRAGLHDTADNAVKFIRANKGGPFYVNVWLHESHTPHVPTAESMAKWKHLDEQKQVYSAVITDGDNAVGQVLDALKEAGVEENTIVIFSADNGPEWTGGEESEEDGPKATARGPASARPGDFAAASEVCSRAASARRSSCAGPATRLPGTKNDKTVFTAVDLLPTLCAAAGVKLPDDYHGDGENLLEAFHGKEVSRTRPIFWEWRGNKTEPDWWPRLAVREGDWKLAMTYDASRVELHQLINDRAEAKDVSEEHPEVVARLSKLALDWKASLPEKPDPECISKVRARTRTKDQAGRAGQEGHGRAARKAFARWDTNQDGVLTLDEYKAGLKGESNLEARFNASTKTATAN